MPALKEVKEEPEDEGGSLLALADPVQMPPTLVLEKLEELLKAGRVMLRYEVSADKGWGINGKISSEWRSFRVESNGVCQFVDDTVWSTDDKDGWADDELEQLEGLRKKAEAFPASQSKQPTALRPRECRRAVFDFYRAKHAESRKAKAKAKGKVKAGAKPKAKPPAKPPVAGPVDLSEDEEPEPDEDAEAEAEEETKVAPKAPAKAPAKAHPAKSSPAKAVTKASPPAVAKVGAKAVAKASAAPEVTTFKEFLDAAKARFLKAGHKDHYKRFLGAVTKGGSQQAILESLAEHPDLAEMFKCLKQGGQPAASPAATGPRQPKEPPPQQLRAAAKVVKAAPPKPAEPPTLPPPRSLPAKALDVEAEVMKPLRQRHSNDAAAQLVSLVFGGRGAKASTRLKALRYVRGHLFDKESFRRLILVRGPPASGKSTWAMEQLKMEAIPAPTEDEELVARLLHVCAADDFLTKFSQGDEEVYTHAEGKELEDAHARNEARVRLAIEAGVHPLYVDAANTQLWEMTPFLRSAQKAGYDVTFTDPIEICSEWDNIETLLARNSARKQASKAVSRDALEAALVHFEAMPDDGAEFVKTVLAAKPGCRHPTAARPAAAAVLAARKTAFQAGGSDKSDSVTSGGAKAGSAGIAAAKRPAEEAAAEAAPPKVAKASPPEAAPKLGKPGAEGRVAAALLSSLRKKPK